MLPFEEIIQLTCHFVRHLWPYYSQLSIISQLGYHTVLIMLDPVCYVDYISKCVLIFQINAPSNTIATEVEFKYCI